MPTHIVHCQTYSCGFCAVCLPARGVGARRRSPCGPSPGRCAGRPTPRGHERRRPSPARVRAGCAGPGRCIRGVRGAVEAAVVRKLGVFRPDQPTRQANDRAVPRDERRTRTPDTLPAKSRGARCAFVGCPSLRRTGAPGRWGSAPRGERVRSARSGRQHTSHPLSPVSP